MSTSPQSEIPWTPVRRPWSAWDGLALGIWTVAIAGFFWDVVSLQNALFYFDITEINFPYRDFFANELKAGRFSRWHPGLYCGLPLYSESQVGYLHPLKYPLYPWMETWKAFGLDTVLSVWLTGLATYGWLRRHVGTIGALTGASIFGLSGFVWAHLIHTSMANALISVPLAIWALECAWDGGRLRGVALGGLALACQVFAGHLQDTLLTALLVGFYGLYRMTIEPGWRERLFAGGTAVGLVAVGVTLSAVQWVPSVELLNRSPRAEGLTWEQLTYGSWHPELLPTVVVREAYGTRARDTDWMDGFYPYHEMNTYMGILGIALAVIGAAAFRDRWVAFWVIVVGFGGLLMLGRYTCLLDYANRLPFLGSSRIPVRFHLWVSLAVAALAAVGADRLARPELGRVRIRWALGLVGVIVVASIPILVFIYAPVWEQPDRWPSPYHQARYRWLGNELVWASARTGAVVLVGWVVAVTAARSTKRRTLVASALPVLIIADLLGAHWFDVPTIDPSYWTEAPESAQAILDDPAHQRVFGLGRFSAGEPGYAVTSINFFAARDTLAWSLAPIWGLDSSAGETPMIPRRWKAYMDAATQGGGRFDIEGVTHVLNGYPGRIPGWPEPLTVGTAYIFKNPNAQPRARLMGRPVYVEGEPDAIAAVEQLGNVMLDRVIVEDPVRPLPADADVSGGAEIVEELPERVVVRVESETDAYLVLADTFDPGWTATVDGRPVPIRPAFVNFRAVFVPSGQHEVIFKYRPAGFQAGLIATFLGGILALGLLVWPKRFVTLGPTHGLLHWPRSWPWWGLVLLLVVVFGSAFRVDSDGVRIHPRWHNSAHQFTWGAGLEAMQRAPMMQE